MHGTPNCAPSRRLGVLFVFATVTALTACQGPAQPDLDAVYGEVSRAAKDLRTPVILVPGILGSKLTNTAGDKVWGAFTRGAVDTDFADGARTFALPMAEGKPLADLRDDVYASEVLDVLVADIGPFSGLNFAAYLGIINVLNIGGYRDRDLAPRAVASYGEGHYTCFQYAYDWRRDVSESAAGLAAFVRVTQDSVREARGLDANEPVRIDIIAHSMGGLALRYYLRYGDQPLPEDGSLPELTWAGAENVRKAILVGTPNAGSVDAFLELVDGLNLHPLFPNYRPSVLGTLPSIYQLMPRTRHGAVVDGAGEALDLYDPGTWVRNGWGLAAHRPDRALDWLLDDIDSGARGRVALDHLGKCLARAEQFHRALDLPASPPAGTTISLFAGDANPTPTVLRANAHGALRVMDRAPGDGTVPRSSALMDERLGGDAVPPLRSPVDWARVQFIFADHVKLTSSPAFIDNMLFMLLEQP